MRINAQGQLVADKYFIVVDRRQPGFNWFAASDPNNVWHSDHFRGGYATCYTTECEAEEVIPQIKECCGCHIPDLAIIELTPTQATRFLKP